MREKQNSKHTSILYNNSAKVPLSLKVSMIVRKKMFKLFMDLFQPEKDHRILDVGVTSDDTYSVSNFFEKYYPYPEKITCVGTEDGSFLIKKYPGLKYIKVEPGKALPFKDKEFDIVFSNAVVEHAGGVKEQQLFVNEICRVSKNFFITTPNRWFPVETHTGIPLLHYFPKEFFRKLIRNTRYDYWSYEKNLNLLSYNGLKGLFTIEDRENYNIQVKRMRFFEITSNLVAFNARRIES